MQVARPPAEAGSGRPECGRRPGVGRLEAAMRGAMGARHRHRRPRFQTSAPKTPAWFVRSTPASERSPECREVPAWGHELE